MKKLLYIFAASAALTATSCVKEQFTDNEPKEGVTVFYGKALDVKTAVVDGHTVWTANDNIKVFFDNKSVEASLKTGEGTSTATFEAAVGTATDYYAVYPASESAAMADGKITVSIPAAQDGQFGAGHVAVAKAAEKIFTFANVNAFLKMTLATAQYTKIVVESVAGEALAGDLSVGFASGAAVLDDQKSNVSSSVEVVSESAFAAGDLYISVLPGVTHTKGLLVKCYNGEQLKGTYLVDKEVVTEPSVTLTFDVFEPNGNYYVSAEGAGNQNGLSWTNAMSASKMVALLQKSTSDESALAAVNGAVFNMAEGEYVLAEGAVALAYETAEPVKITFKGENVVFSGNETHSIMSIAGADVTLEGVTITKSVATATLTGAIKVTGENTALTMNGCTVSGNTVNGDQIACGGVVLLDGASFAASDCVFTENTAYTSSCLYADGAKLTLTGCDFISNYVDAQVGVMYLTGEQESSFTDCDFIDNHAWEYGQIQHVSGNTTFTNCNFKENGVNDSKYPGVFQLDDGGSGKVTIIGGECSGNQAGSCGVVNQEATGAELVMTDVVLKDNYGKEKAGSMWVAAKVTLTGCTFKANSSDATDKKMGQDLLLANGADVKMYGCTIADHVGKKSSNAVSVNDGAKLTMDVDDRTGTRCLVKNNTADWGGAFTLLGSSDTRIYDTDFEENHAQGAATLRIQESADVTLDGCVFTGNYTTNGNGGAFAFESGGTLYCNRCHFEGNHANNEGGAIKVDNGGSDVYLNACTFKGNYTEKAPSGTTIQVHTNNSFAMNNCTIADDTYSVSNHASEPRISWLSFNEPLKIWMSNNTLIGLPRHNGSPTYGGLLRIWLDVDTDAYFVNNIVVNETQENTWSFCQYAKTLTQENVPSVKLYHTKYSVFEGASDCLERLVFMENPTSSDFKPTSFGSLTWNESQCYWSWNGTMTGGNNTGKITKDQFVTTMNDALPEFKAWLEEIGELTKDQLGNERGTGEWWPGSYQKN